MVTLIQLSAFALWALAISLVVAGALLSLRQARRERRRTSELQSAANVRFRPISVLKPLKGLDADLVANLTTFFRLEYPSFELIFLIADHDDPAISVVRRLQSRFINVSSRLVIGDEKIGANPKVNNLVRGFELARHDWILISDSNVSVDHEYLKRIALQFDDDVGVLTAIVRGTKATTLAGHLEKIFLNTFYARWMYLSFAFQQPVVLGKSMMLNRRAAERFGGFKTLACYLAEDYMAGEAMRKLGYRIELLDYAVSQPLPHYTLAQFWKRHLRWGRIRKSQAPFLFVLEPLLSLVPAGLIGAAVIGPVTGLSPSTFFLAHITVWYLADQTINARLARYHRVRSFLTSFPFWCLRELLALPMWLHIASSNRVEWRGRKLRVEYGGILKAGEP